MKNIPTKAILLFSAGILLFILISITIMLFSQETSPEPARSLPTPVVPTLALATSPLTIKDAPSVAPNQGGGTDVDSQIVKSSASEITKLYPLLPFDTEFTSSENISASILIPDESLQINPHSLRVQIFGIDYQIPTNDPAYKSNKESFIEAANIVFAWIKNNNVEPEKIIYIWGDKAFIQERAERWLNESN